MFHRQTVCYQLLCLTEYCNFLFSFRFLILTLFSIIVTLIDQLLGYIVFMFVDIQCTSVCHISHKGEV